MFKKTLSFLLAMLMMLVPLTAFGADTGKTVHWTCDYTEEGGEDILFAGTLSAGENTCTADPSGNSNAYEFTAPQCGVYAFNISFDCDNYSYSAYCSESVDGSEVFGADLGGYSDEYGDIFFFDDDETQLFCIWAEGETDTFTVTLDYLGKVTDLCIAGDKDAYQAGMEVFLSELDDGFYFSAWEGFTFTTDKGTVFNDTALALPVEFSELVSGENKVDAFVYGLEKELTFNVFYSSDYIDSVSPDEGFVPPTMTLDRSGLFTDYEIPAESGKLVFHMKDGSEKKVDIDASCSDICVECEDGTVITLYSDFIFTEDSVIYSLSDGLTSFSVADVVTVKESFIKSFIDSVKAFFSRIIMFFRSLFGGNFY